MPGPLAALAAYILWGVLPIYWKLMQAMPALAILAFRIIFSLVFVAGLLVLARRLGAVRQVFGQARKLGLVLAAAMLISVNWGIYIWAVNAGLIVECALGYYINPLVSISLGMLFMRERLMPLQFVSVGLGLAGVLAMGFDYGRVPWVALSLALSFGLYGLVKKLVGLNAMISLGLETLFALPVAILGLAMLGSAANPSVLGATGWLLAALAGPITAVPLMLFGHAASRIPLSMLGFIQYVSPTISLALGIFVFHEPFGTVQLLSFACIWAALVVFSTDQFRARARNAIVEV